MWTRRSELDSPLFESRWLFLTVVFLIIEFISGSCISVSFHQYLKLRICFSLLCISEMAHYTAVGLTVTSPGWRKPVHTLLACSDGKIQHRLCPFPAAQKTSVLLSDMECCQQFHQHESPGKKFEHCIWHYFKCWFKIIESKVFSNNVVVLP